MKATIKDIAEHAQVSITTVSLVLNNKPCRVSKETKKRIVAVANELNYIQNQVARSLVTAETKTVGLILPDITNPFFSQLAKGIGDALNQKGYTMLLANSYNDLHNELKQMKKFQQHAIDGLIITTVNSQSYEERFEKSLTYPMVILDRHIVNSKRPSIVIDDYSGGYAATDYLVRKGHTRIAMLSGERIHENALERLRGYKQALADNDIAMDDSLIFYGDFSIEKGYEQGLAILQTDASAVFVANDLMAIGLYQACREQGCTIPDNLSVIGFDDIPMAKLLSPSLTTIHQPIYQIGLAAVDTLLQLIKNPNNQPANTVFPVNLMIRDSVKEVNCKQKSILVR